MKLIRCHIENFGCLSDLDLSFEEGLNSFFRENGWGKSTFAAFLRAMFYGLSGERKQKLEENERKHYKPWQGGVFGGSLIFEAGGKTYLVSRIFGDKETKDEFELRDAATNRLSEDYSCRLGEELFQISRESFLRTVFISQNDCVTSVNGDIHGKIGELTEDSRDLNRYEDAVKRLTEQINQLTPHRSTGSISRRKKEIAERSEQVRRGERISEELDHEEQLLETDRYASHKLQTEIARLEILQAQESGSQRARAEREEWMRLKEKQKRLVKQAEAMRDHFPGRVPSVEEIHERIHESNELQKSGQTLEHYRLSEKEESELKRLDILFRNDLPTEAELNQKIRKATETARRLSRNGRTDLNQRERKQDASEETSLWLLLTILPAILLIGGGLGFFLLLHIKPGLIAVAAGVIYACFGLYHLRRDTGNIHESKNKDCKQENHSAAEPYEAGQSLTDVAESCQDPVLALEELFHIKEQAEHYRFLLRKQQDYQEAEADYQTYREEILVFLDSLRIRPEYNLSEQLYQLRDWADDYYDSVRDRDAVQKELESFEEQHDMDRIHTLSGMKEDTAAHPLSLDAIGVQLAMFRRKKEELDHQIRLRLRSVEILQGNLDECQEQKEILEELMEKQDAEEQRFYALTKAREGLIKAKEALTARYTDPVFDRFSFYYELLTGMSSAPYRMDGDARLTFMDQGKQRTLNTLSAGWQDLTGICLRMALVDAMYQKEKPMIILDDPFVNLDDEKLRAAGELLRELSITYQILYFTCSSIRVTA